MPIEWVYPAYDSKHNRWNNITYSHTLSHRMAFWHFFFMHQNLAYEKTCSYGIPNIWNGRYLRLLSTNVWFSWNINIISFAWINILLPFFMASLSFFITKALHYTISKNISKMLHVCMQRVTKNNSIIKDKINAHLKSLS